MLHTPIPLRLSVNKRRFHLSPRTPSFTSNPPATPSLPLSGTSFPSPAAPPSPALGLSHNPRKRFSSPTSASSLEAGGSRIDCQRPTKRIRSLGNEDKGNHKGPLGLSISTGTSVEHGKMEDIEMREDGDNVHIKTGDEEESFGNVPSYQARTIGKPFPTAQSGLPQSTPLFPPLPALAMRRSNPKKLSLSLPSSSSSSTSSTPTATGPSDSTFPTPFTPGPPRTPALAMSTGRSTTRGLRRPSLLSLITQPPSGDAVPPTPSVGMHPYATMHMPRSKGRARSQTAEEIFTTRPENKGGSWSATPLGMGMGVPTIEETEGSSLTTSGLDQLGYALPSSSPQKPASDSSSSTSFSASTNTTPSTSPPLPASISFSKPYPVRQAEPYEDGPIEVVPGVWLGAEESAWRFGVWAVGKSKVRIVNVAQEIDDPFDLSVRADPGWSGTGSEKKGSMKLKTYPSISEGPAARPEVEYCHVRWSHGELGLADLPEKATLGDVRRPQGPEVQDMWKFWQAIRWMEEGRKSGTPVLIHCQCGVSRSATLTIAYVMALAAAGTMPEYLGHIRSMQDAYDFVKNKSSWIGPNHSLVFQLVDFARNLTSLLSLHYSADPAEHIPTSFPTSADAELSEAEWARRRREFDESEHLDHSSSSVGSEGRRTSDESGSGSDCMSPEEAGDEARRLDDAMVARRALREAV
ncbi:hypothetical protein I350_05865 [Cryptococcus amylolentus CBS 6273]|uniref:protein-tyrosine-phosphatase n=1 Tax=Cryptococcus amylolentus CBS 6273 TaxID=1296118 RepID=A0A1E3JQ77_9TREE|nr:hypothetical protein I350_05865 [Cryptococcus amylolentus CBS 6273]